MTKLTRRALLQGAVATPLGAPIAVDGATYAADILASEAYGVVQIAPMAAPQATGLSAVIARVLGLASALKAAP